MTLGEKIDKLLEDLAHVKTDVALIKDRGSLLREEVDELKEQVKPVVQHVASLRFVVKLVLVLVPVGSLVVGIVALALRHS